MTGRVLIYDTTLRDGEQAPGAAMLPSQKLLLAEELQALGVDVIEAGFPAASEEDARAVAAIAGKCRNVQVSAFARSVPSDILIAASSVKRAAAPRVTVVAPVSDLHLRHKLRMNREAALGMISSSVSLARQHCPEVEFIAEDGTRSEPEYLCRAMETAIDAGATFVTMADTVGYSTPKDIETYLTAIRNRVDSLDKAVLGIHCHDDLGLANINTLTAIEAGARQVHCTLNGIGERAGNTALEEVVMALVVRADRYPFQVAIDTTRLWAISRLVEEITGFLVPPNKPIIGANTFSHGSGMHQDGILKAAGTYEIIDPARVGAPQRQLPITRHSGRKGLLARADSLGMTLTDEQVDEVFQNLKGRMAGNRILADDELRKLIEAVLVQPER